MSDRFSARLLIPIGAGILIVLIWFIAFWGPQGSALSDAKKRSEAASAQLEQLRAQITRLREAQRDLPLKQAQLETLRVAIPDDPNLAQFILDANDAASKSGIDFLSIAPTPPSASTPTATTPPTTAVGGSAGGTAGGAVSAATTPTDIRIAMTISGGYFQVLDFMNRLNLLPRIVVIDSVSLTADATGSTLSVSMQERIFTTPQGAAAGGTGTGTGAAGTTTTTVAGATTTTGPGGATATTVARATTPTTTR